MTRYEAESKLMHAIAHLERQVADRTLTEEDTLSIQMAITMLWTLSWMVKDK